jgi:hypothetical protein
MRRRGHRTEMMRWSTLSVVASRLLTVAVYSLLADRTIYRGE